jgi:regulator of RNase E activity RraA
MESDAVGGGTPTARLARLDTGAVSDALDRLGLPGTVHGIHARWPGPRLAGRLVTVQLKAAGPGEVPTRHLGVTAIATAGPGDLVLMAAGERTDAAAWGGLLSLAARLKGLAGVIVDGACRDVDESREVGFPVFARAAVPTTARGRLVEEATGVPVRVAGVTVNTGDLAIADASGVVFVAAARAEEVLALAEEVARRESLMAQDLRSGKAVVDVIGASYESMLEPREK